MASRICRVKIDYTHAPATHSISHTCTHPQSTVSQLFEIESLANCKAFQVCNCNLKRIYKCECFTFFRFYPLNLVNTAIRNTSDMLVCLCVNLHTFEVEFELLARKNYAARLWHVRRNGV